jgi:hypothetical protein
MILWRREPKFKEIVRPERPPEKVYCEVFEGKDPLGKGTCKNEIDWIPRMAGVLVVPDRSSRAYWVGERFGFVGGAFLLYPGTLRPGTCKDDSGEEDMSYLCAYPHLCESEGDWWSCSLERVYFRLRDDIEEVGGRIDRTGHPVYIVRNRLGETFRLVGVYARVYEALRERGGWVRGGDLIDDETRLLKRYTSSLKDFVDRKSDEELEEMYAEYANTLVEVSERLTDLLLKLNHGKVEELPPPGVIPAGLERALSKVESLEFLIELDMLERLAKKEKNEHGWDEGEALEAVLFFNLIQALGLLVYEALIVEMGVV